MPIFRAVMFALMGAMVASSMGQMPIGALGAVGQWVEVSAHPAPPGGLQWRETRTAISRIESLTFPSSVTTAYPVNNEVPLMLMLPLHQRGRVPVVMLLHYLGARDVRAEESLGSKLNREGIAAIIIVLPYHMERAPEGTRSGQLAIQAKPEALIAFVIQAVQDVRRGLDIVEMRDDIDTTRVGIAGVSLGSLVAEVAFGVDTRFSHAAFMLGGANAARLLWSSSTIAVDHGALLRRGLTEESLRTILAPIEPATYLSAREAATHEDGSDVFVISARYDSVIPPPCTAAMVSALGNPIRLQLDTGHYGGFFVQARVLDQVASYFSDIDSGKAFVPPKGIYAPTVRLAVQAVTPTGFDIGVGIDYFQSKEALPWFGSFILTPRGPEAYFGKSIGQGFSVGASLGLRGPGVGLVWSVVL